MNTAFVASKRWVAENQGTCFRLMMMITDELKDTLKVPGEVISINYDHLSILRTGRKEFPPELEQKGVEILKRAELIVAEVTLDPEEVERQIRSAGGGRPILCLYRPTQNGAPKILKGIPNVKFESYRWLGEAGQPIDAFMRANSGKLKRG